MYKYICTFINNTWLIYTYIFLNKTTLHNIPSFVCFRPDHWYWIANWFAPVLRTDKVIRKYTWNLFCTAKRRWMRLGRKGKSSHTLVFQHLSLTRWACPFVTGTICSSSATIVISAGRQGKRFLRAYRTCTSAQPSNHFLLHSCNYGLSEQAHEKQAGKSSLWLQICIFC